MTCLAVDGIRAVPNEQCFHLGSRSKTFGISVYDNKRPIVSPRNHVIGDLTAFTNTAYRKGMFG